MSEPLRIVVAEDEPYNLKRLVRLLKGQGCEVVAELEDGIAVMEWLEGGGSADALFLDVQMPGLTGLEVMAEIQEGLPVVLVTAFAEHAVKAFEHAALDYLLKPVTEERLALTLERLRSARSSAVRPVQSGPFRYPVKAGEGLVLLDLGKTSHFEFKGGAVWAHAGGEWRTLWKTLAEAEQALEGRGLIRGHRHLLLRPEAVLGARNLDSGRMLVKLQGGLEVEISRGAAPGLKSRLGIP
ncbi:LytR/AlgR family response regulator transcription factor [Mesoterricola silvestris]|uniref:DNA-binding response regulator n=1 Tax=Mesoterricola silvestris TaxID=2927979 RepID=A0AA48GLB5_9BACT|nr:LytTR family DNA-binding domain-containing protein [Mesoterricola silvestris]BDU71894.1 DNA-binding response regulator [Mesoterricola silvestris]